MSNCSFSPTLVLNADYQPLSYFPLSLWSWQDTIKAVLAEEILFGKLSKAGGVASVTLVNGKINVNLTENPNKKEKVKH